MGNSVEMRGNAFFLMAFSLVHSTNRVEKNHAALEFIVLIRVS